MLIRDKTNAELRDAVINFLAAADEPKTKDEITTGIQSENSRTVFEILRVLAREQKVRKFSRYSGSSVVTLWDLNPKFKDQVQIDESQEEGIDSRREANYPDGSGREEVPPAPDLTVSTQVEPEDESTSGSVQEEERSLALFKGIDPASRTSVLQAFLRVKAELVSIPAPRSLCELQLSKEDFHWLCTWASSPMRGVLNEYLTKAPWERPGEFEGFSKREAVGTILLLLAAEAARRESREGTVWPTFLSKFSEDNLKCVGFLDGVNAAVRHAIEDAAHALRLRNVFGKTGIQYYYISIFLQFGITRRGLRQLPYWFSGREPTETVRYLLEKGSATFSESFRKFLNFVSGYRKGTLTLSKFRSFLQTCPWILSEWEDEVVTLAKAEPGEEDVLDDDLEDRLISRPKFVWNWPDEPFFEIRLCNSGAVELGDGEYTFRVEGFQDFQVKKANNRLSCSSPIRIPLTVPQPTISIIDADGVEQTRLELELWDSSEEIIIFDSVTGQQIEPFEQYVRTTRSYVLLTSADLQPTQDIDKWLYIKALGKKCWYLVEGWKSDFALNWSDGELCWEPNISGNGSVDLPFPVKSISVKSDKSRAELGEELNVRLIVPSGVSLRSVKVCGSRQELDSNVGTINLPPFKVTAKVAASGFKVQIVAEYKEKKYSLSKEIGVSTTGSVRWNGFSWEPISPNSVIDAQEATGYTYKFFLTKKVRENIGDYGIFEGNSFCNRLKKRRQPIGMLTGYGAPIRIKRLFNATAEDDEIQLCRSVTKTGVLESVEQIDPVTVEVRLKQPLSLSSSHSVVFWCETGDVSVLDFSQIIQCGETSWQAICPNMTDIAACGIAYEGARIGGIWPSSIESFLENVSRKAWPESVASYIRWMGFPILAEQNFQSIQAFSHKYADEVLAAWLSETHVDRSFVYQDDWDEWMVIVRRVFRNWFPPSFELAEKIVNRLTEESDSRSILSSAALKLIQCDPCLMYRVVSLWARHHNDQGQIGDCLNAILRLRKGSSQKDQQYWHDDCLEMVARSWKTRIDRRFFENTARNVKAELDRDGVLQENTLSNLDSLLPDSTFREYLGTYLLLKS